MSALLHIPRADNVIDRYIAALMLATLHAASAASEAASAQAEADRIASDLAANRNKAARARLSNERKAFALQMQHQSRDFL